MGAQTSRNSWYQPSMTHSSASQPTQPARPTSWYYGQSSSEPAFPSVAESVMTPSLAYTNTLHPNNGTASAAFAAAAVPSVDTTTYHRNSSHYINPAFAPLTQPLHPSQTISQSSSTAKQEQRHIYTHSRSRSVPYSVPPPEPPVSENRDVFAFDTIGASMSKQQQQQQQQQQAKPSPLVSRASMDADSFQRLSSSIDTGQSLLLTKYYVPPKASNNPFENDTIAESPPVSDHNNNSNSNSIVTPPPEPSSSSSSTAPHTTTTALERSPFADLQESASLSSSDTTPRLPLSISSAQPKRTTPAWPGINDRPNKENVYPPPVPPQSTKPAFPKYARNTFPNLLRRTQSYKDPFETTPIQGTGSLLFSTNPWSSTDASSSPTAPAVKLFRHRSDGSTLTARR
ncbi:hypothetical protein BCR43DRAFT_149607 [Syncephalastrum racemosum]|uniref:Uncharacterized protein n=1 Tax=Syncephalastrum racemosum TaxID=13706 RepID=A0A1X2HMP4_SYNRA|nr:hypothetical protein BCR43DRAFT_149607 [Syncephalastrum racemosum]